MSTVKFWFCVALALASAILSIAEDKGTCPPPPMVSMSRPSKKAAQSAELERQTIRTVSLLAVISDKGYVCSAQVVRGTNKKTDAEAVRAVRQWRFNPATNDGHPAPAAVRIDVKYRIDEDGNIAVTSPTKQVDEPAKQ